MTAVLCRHLCADAGWDWAQELPATTSALLQAVEVAAAAEVPQHGDAAQPAPSHDEPLSDANPAEPLADHNSNIGLRKSAVVAVDAAGGSAHVGAAAAAADAAAVSAPAAEAAAAASLRAMASSRYSNKRVDAVEPHRQRSRGCWS